MSTACYWKFMIAGITGYVMVWTRKHVWEALKISVQGGW